MDDLSRSAEEIRSLLNNGETERAFEKIDHLPDAGGFSRTVEALALQATIASIRSRYFPDLSENETVQTLDALAKKISFDLRGLRPLKRSHVRKGSTSLR